MERELARTRWSQGWLLLGLLSSVALLSVDGRANMLGVIFYFSLFTVAGVACAHSLARAGCQLCLGVALFVLSSAVFIRLGVAPIFAPTLWLGLLAGSANFLAGQPLTMLVLGGQLLPILVAGVAWTPQGLAPLSAVLCVLLAGLACLAGSLLARGLSLR